MTAKFMAIPHYPYLTLKMPGPKGVLTFKYDPRQSLQCDIKSCELATQANEEIEREEVRKDADKMGNIDVAPSARRKTKRCCRQTRSPLKQSPLTPKTCPRPPILARTWTPNRKVRSFFSSNKIGTSLHDRLLTCQEFLEIRLSIN